VPSRPEQLQAYDAVVYNDINADSMTPFQMKLMQAAAKDSGLGFAMIGGENSFLPGGYFGTPIADILPVDLNIKRRESFPSTSVCIVCDTSGSMGIPEDGIPKVRLAAKAAEEAVLMMSPLDRCGVAGSTDTIEFVAPMQRVTDKEAMIRQIRTMTAGGGGIYVRPSLEFGRKALEREDSKVRHMILMADGTDCDTREGCEELAAQMRSEKITVSTIAMGAGQYVPFLKRVAAAGGGRFFLAQKASELPAVFTQDTAVMSRSAIQDGAFLPKAAMGEDALKGIDPATIPPLFAYCLSDSRSLADVGMKTNHDDPLLATWQYGLANTLAFTSDAQPRWAARWVNWESFGMFWAQAIRSITRRATLNAYEVSTSEEGGKGVVQVKAVDAAGNPLKRFAAEVRVSSPTGRSMTVPVSQKAPGVFRGQFDADEIGSYIVTVAEDDPAGGKRVDATGLSIPYPPEYRDFRANEPLLDQVSKASGGMSLLHPEDAARPVAEPGHSIQELWQLLVFLAAVLLPLDVGARRVAVPVGEAWQKAVAWWRAARLKQSRPHPQTIVVERLQRAKRPAASESKPAPEPVVIEQAERPQSAPPSAATSTGSAASKLLEAKRKRQG
jgi:uncharacterized membrane protein